MKLRYKDPTYKQIEEESTYNASFAMAVVKMYRRRIQLIRGALDERDFYALKSLHFEKLKGERSHQYSMRLNDQFRLILEYEGTPPNKVVVVMGIEKHYRK